MPIYYFNIQTAKERYFLIRNVNCLLYLLPLSRALPSSKRQLNAINICYIKLSRFM